MCDNVHKKYNLNSQTNNTLRAVLSPVHVGCQVDFLMNDAETDREMSRHTFTTKDTLTLSFPEDSLKYFIMCIREGQFNPFHTMI